jgi:hypothetical protein
VDLKLKKQTALAKLTLNKSLSALAKAKRMEDYFHKFG